MYDAISFYQITTFNIYQNEIFEQRLMSCCSYFPLYNPVTRSDAFTFSAYYLVNIAGVYSNSDDKNAIYQGEK